MKNSIHDPVYKTLVVTSPVFKDQEYMPSRYTCDGQHINPPLDIDHIPTDAKCLCLIVDDPDAPAGLWIHWVVWNIPVTHHIAENSIPGIQGANTSGRQNYVGPCPPSGTHRYFFKIYALDATLDLPSSADKHQLEQAMAPHILAFGEIMGRYERRK